MIYTFTQNAMLAYGDKEAMDTAANFTVSTRTKVGSVVTLRINGMRITFATDRLEKILEKARNVRK